MRKQVCVIGLGRFGETVARELFQSGHDVLAIDTDEAKIQAQSGQVTYAVRGDATNEAMLRELDVQQYDAAVVALGNDNIQTSVLVTVLLKSMNIPYIVARAANDLHGQTLERIGANQVVFPEADSARRTAHLHFAHGIMDYMSIVPNYGISKIRPTESMLGKTLEEAGMGRSRRQGMAVLAIRRGRSSLINPPPDERIQLGDILMIVSTNEHLTELSEALEAAYPVNGAG